MRQTKSKLLQSQKLPSSGGGPSCSSVSALVSDSWNIKNRFVTKRGSRCSLVSTKVSKNSSIVRSSYSAESFSQSLSLKATLCVASKQHSASSKSRSSNSSQNNSAICVVASACTRSSLTKCRIEMKEST